MSTVSELKDAINKVRYNPAAIQREVFQLLEHVSGGELDVIDPTNPFVFLLEASAVNASATMVEAEALTRQQYPSMAQTEDELYLHMSDRDYIGRFANPSRTVFTLLINKAELIRRAVATPEAGIRKLVIPRNTEFRVSDYTFTMEYPIELRVMSHGGIQVVYDGSEPSPLQTLESNLVDWTVTQVYDDEFIMIKIPVNQFLITTYYAHINQSSSFSKSFQLVDTFYACRVYRRHEGQWREVRITHTDQVFDPNVPTVILRVYEGSLRVTVPQIYVTNRSLDTELRIDVYTTKGPLDLILDSYEVNDFSATWRDIGAGESNAYAAPLDVFSSLAVFSDAVVSGGTAGLTFEQVRDRVIMNALGNSQLPITNVQLSTRLENYGYQAIKDIDNVTNRIYLASRRLPPPSNGNTVAAASNLITLLQGSFLELSQYAGVINNDSRITLTSDALFIRSNGVLQLLPDHQRDALLAMQGELLVGEVNRITPLMTPFHYVLDANGDIFQCRPYYMDGPTIASREFIEENVSVGLSLSTSKVAFFKREGGYALQLTTQSGTLVQTLGDDQITVQLSFRPYNERRDVFVRGELVRRLDNGERVFEFHFETRFDIDEEHHLWLNNFAMYAGEVKSYPCDLTTPFNIVYYVEDYQPVDEVRALRYEGAGFLLNGAAHGIVHERATLRFGDFLEGFWENSRSVAGSQTYLTHSEDIYATHDRNLYARDPVTGSIQVTVGESGEIEYTVLHRKGDPILDAKGEPTLRFRKGDPILDGEGNPIVENERSVVRQVDIFLVDARYRFATRESDIGYLGEIPRTIVGWLQGDLKEFRQWALEQTEIFLYPMTTTGTVQALVREGELRTLELEQGFTVTYYLSRDKYANSYVRQTLTELTREVLAESLLRKRITVSEMVSKLSARAGDDAIAIDLVGLGGNTPVSALTLAEDSKRCSIRKRLERSIDGKLQVVDDITVIFLRHEV